MNISFLLGNNSNELSGGYKIIFQYANYLAEHGHSVTLYFFADRTIYVLPSYIPVPVKKTYARLKNRIIPTWFKLRIEVQKKVIFSLEAVEDADVVIATAVRTAVPVANLRPSKGRKFYFIQGFENWKCSDEEVYKTYALGMTNIVVSKWLRGIVDNYSNKTSVLVQNGLDLSVFQAHSGERDPHSIVTHYRNQKVKGCEYAFEAIRILEERYSDLNVTVIGIEKNAPKDLPQSCTYIHNINQEKVAEINNRSTVFLCSSIEEGFGLPGLEGMACGCVLVSSTFQGVLEYAVDGKNALLVPTRDGKALAEAVQKVFEDNKLKDNLISTGLREIKKRSLEDCAEKFMNAITGGIL